MDGDWQFPFSIPVDCFIHSFLKHLQEKMSLGLRGKGVPAGEWIIASAVKTSLGDIVLRPTVYWVKYQLFRSVDQILTNVTRVGQTQGS